MSEQLDDWTPSGGCATVTIAAVSSRLSGDDRDVHAGTTEAAPHASPHPSAATPGRSAGGPGRATRVIVGGGRNCDRDRRRHRLAGFVAAATNGRPALVTDNDRAPGRSGSPSPSDDPRRGPAPRTGVVIRRSASGTRCEEFTLTRIDAPEAKRPDVRGLHFSRFGAGRVLPDGPLPSGSAAGCAAGDVAFDLLGPAAVIHVAPPAAVVT